MDVDLLGDRRRLQRILDPATRRPRSHVDVQIPAQFSFHLVNFSLLFFIIYKILLFFIELFLSSIFFIFIYIYLYSYYYYLPQALQEKKKMKWAQFWQRAKDGATVGDAGSYSLAVTDTTN